MVFSKNHRFNLNFAVISNISNKFIIQSKLTPHHCSLLFFFFIHYVGSKLNLNSIPFGLPKWKHKTRKLCKKCSQLGNFGSFATFVFNRKILFLPAAEAYPERFSFLDIAFTTISGPTVWSHRGGFGSIQNKNSMDRIFLHVNNKAGSC